MTMIVVARFVMVGGGCLCNGQWWLSLQWLVVARYVVVGGDWFMMGL